MSVPQPTFELIYELMNSGEKFMTVSELCKVLNVSRSGYYNWLKGAEAREKREQQDQADFSLILDAHKAHGRFKGARAISMELAHRPEPVIMNVKKIRRLTKKYNLECPIRKANPYRRMAAAMKTSRVAPNV